MRVSFSAGSHYHVINLDLVERIFTESVEGSEFPYKLAFVYNDSNVQKVGFKEEELRAKYLAKIEALWNSVNLEDELEKPKPATFEPEALERDLKGYDPMAALK